MRPSDLVEAVYRCGGEIHREGDCIRLSAPRPLPGELLDTIKAHKAAVMEWLDIGTKSVPGALLPEGDRGNIREHLEERAAIQEYDGGLSRIEAERQARTRLQLYRYTLTDDPSRWFTLLAPGEDLDAAIRTLRNQFGDKRVLEVKIHRIH